MKIFNVSLIGLLSLSIFGSAIGLSQSAVAQMQPDEEQPTSEEGRGVNKDSLDQFCEENADALPQPGIQFDGNLAALEVMQLAPGRYAHPGTAALVLYPDGHYFVRPPVSEQEINGTLTTVREMYATAAPDLLLPMSKVMGGCSIEQLSELMSLNNMSVDALELVAGHNDTYIEGSAYSYLEVINFCTEHGERLERGIQFDGAAASAAVMEMNPGEYGYLGEGLLLLFPDGEFILKFPEARNNVGLTDGPDLYNRIGIIGCSAEQLSEAIAKNDLSVDSFELSMPYN